MITPQQVAAYDQFMAVARAVKTRVGELLAAADEADLYLDLLDDTPLWQRKRRRELYEKYADAERRFGMKPLLWSHFKWFR